MIKLSLNFNTETSFPKNSRDFEQIINTHEFQSWFKIIWSNLIALSSYNNEEVINKNPISPIYTNINDLFLKLQDNNSIKKTFYVLKNDNWYILHIDEDINKWLIDINTYNNTSIFNNKILAILFWEVIFDPYIEKIVEDSLETQLWFKNKISNIIKIVNKNDHLKVSFNCFLEENLWNFDDIDYYKNWWGYIGKKVKIKKEDLI